MIIPKVLVEGKFYPQDLEISVSESSRKIEPWLDSDILLNRAAIRRWHAGARRTAK